MCAFSPSPFFCLCSNNKMSGVLVLFIFAFKILGVSNLVFLELPVVGTGTNAFLAFK